MEKRILGCLVIPTVLLALSSVAQATIVNIDLEGYRTAGGGNNGDSSVDTYVGTGAAGGGTVFNGITPTAVSDNSGSTTTGDNQTLTGSSLLDSTGVATGVGFTIGPVGLDNEYTGNDPTQPGALFGDYVFNNSAGNGSSSVTFTISGLTPGASYNVYAYFNQIPSLTISGATVVPFTPTGIFGAANTAEYLVVADQSGNINGGLGGGTNVFNGLTVASVPEPSSIALLGLGVVGLLAARRRRQA